MPPPSKVLPAAPLTELPVTMQSVSVSVPLLEMPPPLVVAAPPEIVSPEMLAFVVLMKTWTMPRAGDRQDVPRPAAHEEERARAFDHFRTGGLGQGQGAAQGDRMSTGKVRRVELDDAAGRIGVILVVLTIARNEPASLGLSVVSVTV